MRMNLPNKLTIIRILMIPFFLFFLLYKPCGDASPYISLFIFVVASFTDAVDGYLARKYNLITNFGKFMDPLADKLLCASALIAFVQMKELSSIIVIIIISREFLITGFRTVASDAGIVIAASKWGKLKTIFQMIMIIYILIGFTGTTSLFIKNILITVAVVLTIISAIDYIVKNKEVLKV